MLVEEERQRRELDRRITLDLQDEDFADVIKNIRSRFTFAIIVHPSMAASPDPLRVTVSAKDIRLRDALNEMTRQLGTYYSLTNQAIFMHYK